MKKLTKICPQCKLEKPASGYNFYVDGTNGLTCWCRDCSRAKGKALRDRRRSEGVCAKCPKPVVPGRARCKECLEANRTTVKKRYSSRKSADRCYICQGPTENGQYCSECKSRRKNERAALIESGRCVRRCGRPSSQGFLLCGVCWFRGLAKKHLGHRSEVSKLQALWDSQEGLCAISGFPLEQGTASIDHIIHRSKGGPDSIENYRFVHLIVNVMRSDMHDDEFYEWIDRIQAHRSRPHLRLVPSVT